MSDPTISSLRIFDNNNWNITLDEIPGLGPTLRQLVNELKAVFDQVAASAAWLSDRIAAVNTAFGRLGALPDALAGDVRAAPAPPPWSAGSADAAAHGVVDAMQGLNGASYTLLSWIEAPLQGVDSLLAALHDACQHAGMFFQTLAF